MMRKKVLVASIFMLLAGGIAACDMGGGEEECTQCEYKGKKSDCGVEVCQDGAKKKCDDGTWKDLNEKCG